LGPPRQPEPGTVGPSRTWCLTKVPYGPYFGIYGTFGPDRFCGTIRTAKFKRDKNAKRKRVGTRTRHTCRVPPTVTSTVMVTFAAQ
jgi:hypothetical protein